MLIFLIEGLGEKSMLSEPNLLDVHAPNEASEADYERMFEELRRPETDTQAAAVTAGLNWYRYVH